MFVSFCYVRLMIASIDNVVMNQPPVARIIFCLCATDFCMIMFKEVGGSMLKRREQIEYHGNQWQGYSHHAQYA